MAGEVEETRPDIEAILRAGSLSCAYQPVVSIGEGRVLGLEALARASDPSSGRPVPPAELFAAAAGAGRSLELDWLCRRRAMEGFGSFAARDPALLLFVNQDVSIVDDSAGEIARTAALAEEFRLRPDRIAIEILESEVENSAALCRFVLSLRDHGFLVALDDMGAGYSNLERIPAIKPDIIKLDRSLIRGIEQEYHKQELYGLFVKLASKIEAVVIAEGVETGEEALVCLDRGGDLLQGFLFARPLPPGGECLGACLESVAWAKAAVKERRRDFVSSRRRLSARYCEIADDMLLRISGCCAEELDTALEVGLRLYPEVECAYVLDAAGIQTSSTVLNPRCEPRQRSALFAPAVRGSDLSAKEYFVCVDRFQGRYFTEPYISRASGSRCVTVSTAVVDAAGEEMILCLDLASPVGHT
jgi:EAL domain-containing protein (putative c-di-GMP-specific phosphodiesterase class I)